MKQHGENKNLTSVNEDICWETCKEVFIVSADEVLKEEKREIRNCWFDEECSEITQEKNEVYKEMIQKHYTRTVVEKYKQARRKEKSIHKKKKRKYNEKMFEEIEELHNQRETQKFYRKVNGERKPFRTRMIACRQKDGSLITNVEDSMNR